MESALFVFGSLSSPAGLVEATVGISSLKFADFVFSFQTISGHQDLVKNTKSASLELAAKGGTRAMH